MITKNIIKKVGQKPKKINKTYSFPEDLVNKMREISKKTGYSETDLIKMSLEKLFNE